MHHILLPFSKKTSFQILFLLFVLIQINSRAQNTMQEKYNLMPWPTEIIETIANLRIDENFTIGIPDQSNSRVTNYTSKFIKRLSEKTGVFIKEPKAKQIEGSRIFSLILSYEKIGNLKLNEDESYTLVVLQNKIELHAKTDIGVLRGLETLLQLVENNTDYYSFSGVLIKDKPRFPWRGLMIDVARHYEPIAVIKRNLDAMAAVKLNVFHWHLTDDQGFRVEVKSYPKLHQIGSNGQYYTQDEIKGIVQYASDLGIRVIPEFDVPAHATSWLTAYPEIGSKKGASYSAEVNAGIFNPTLDPTNEKTYEIIEAVFTEMATLFPDSYFHIGGDENAGKHWDSNEIIQQFKKDNKLKTNHDLQTYFNIRIQKILQKNNKIMMGWDEIFQPNLPKDVVIHSWRGNKSMLEAAKQGYQTVLSQGYYIDLMHPASKHYLNDPLKENNGLSLEESKNILGGEATMWSELVTPLTIDSRIWPRTAAIAERLWSDSSINDVANMYKRLEFISFELESLGITHIRNQNVILRNIADNQDITALKDLANICEPLKGYTRNKGGTKYKSFSPFTLFADACTADAFDAYRFNQEVANFLINEDSGSLKNINKELTKWSFNYQKLQQIASNPKLEPLLPLSKSLSEVSTLLSKTLINKKISKKELDQLKKQITALQEAFVDVEVMLTDSLAQLIVFCEEHYLED